MLIFAPELETNKKEFKMIINSKNSNVYFVNRTDSIDRYLASIRDYKPLDFNEENMYITRYKVDGDMSARDMLVNCNQRFVYSAAKRFSNDPDTVLELVNEGNIGLIEAIDRFDFTVGCRLLTYAQAYIRRNMVRFFCENKIIKRPSDTKIGSIVANERVNFHAVNERQPTIEELRSIMLNKYNIKVNNDEDLYINNIVYVDDNVADTDDSYTFGDKNDYIKTTSSYNEYEKTIEQDNTKAIITAALSQIDKRSQTIVKMMYGIDCDREYSASELAEMYGMTKTRINQIKNDAQKRLEYLITA